MRGFILTVVFTSILSMIVAGCSSALPRTAGSPTGWSPVILPRGQYRQQIKSMPIEQRPGRPLHIYGNTVRMRDQASGARASRPVRQIFLGRTGMRNDSTVRLR